MKDKTIRLARNGINDLNEYTPGKPIEEVQREYGLDEIIKMASNENPFGPSPKAIEAMTKAINDVNLYPESSSLMLRQKIAGNFGIHEDMVTLANGADNILGLIAQATVNEGDEIVMGDPTFAAYDTRTRIMGGIPVKVPLKNFTYDLPAVAKKITSKTKLVFVCNPNNPTGTIVTREEVEDFMNSVPQECIVVFDEAYAEFVHPNIYPQTIKYIQDQRNVIMVRTFSKLFGLAGLRVGYAVGPKHLISMLRKVVEPFPVNRLAQSGALAAFDDHAFLNRVLTENEKGKEFLYQQFSKMKMAYCPSHTNFIFVDLGMDGQFVFEKLLEQGIIIRPGGLWNYPQFARITIGTSDQNEKLIEALNIIAG
ncbi:histidinol-phosphate transaminase [Candidatus Formimonas warabiya]|uniref:Histidinol-phosphate aminotransferase n=1 Tax=Formimonas warabiya TaxID=1761012 RepID=A0A3G1KZK5_FORW1|nr:histidinol-phosphate transaminase [Candidatus Formimonas warabiya]ATW27821.1 histidinol-phosphate transaminase [Candidatus Formimonas warabiya]